MAMRLWISLASLALTAVTASALLASPGDAQAGKAVYDSKCKTCHGANGEGNAVLAKTLKVTLKDLKSKEVQSKSDDELKKDSTAGTGKMQPVKGLTDKQASDLIAFLRDEQGDAQAGKTVFDSKCKLCHGADGKGNPILAKSLNVTFPDMTSSDVLKGKSDAEVKKGIVEGYNKMKPVKGLSDKQLDDVIAFVRSLAKS